MIQLWNPYGLHNDEDGRDKPGHDGLSFAPGLARQLRCLQAGAMNDAAKLYRLFLARQTDENGQMVAADRAAAR